MLEYFKTILSKVSFDKHLFEKELRKAIESLLPYEVLLLREWCYRKFQDTYQPLLNDCFA